MEAILKSDRGPISVPGPQEVAAEAHHRIANSLTLLVGMVRMQASAVARRAAPLSNPEVRMLLEGVAARINTIGQLHRMLSQAGDDAVTNMRPHLADVTQALTAALSSPEQVITVEHGCGDCLVTMKQVQPLILIVCEIFINAMKYAHPAGVPLVMTVDCAATPQGWMVLTVSDDGVGLPEGFDTHSQGGLGFRVIRGLAAEIGAHLEINSSSLGLCFRLSLPAVVRPG